MFSFHTYVKIIVLTSSFSVGTTRDSDRSKFLYTDNAKTSHVIDFVAPIGTDEKGSTRKDFLPSYDANSTTPNFLTSRNDGNRVVEFYSPTCGHCIHFAPTYSNIATSTFRMDPDIKFYAVSCAANHDICKKFNIQRYPTIMIFKSNTTEIISTRSKDKLQQYILKYFDITDEKKHVAENLLRTQNINASKEKDSITFDFKRGKQSGIDFPSASKVEIASDVFVSFIYNLRNGIYTSNTPLNDKKKHVFTNWLQLLSNTLPINSQILAISQDLIMNIPDIFDNENNLINIVDKFDHGGYLWTESCSKGVSGAGYSCGLWELFHMITLGLLERNKSHENEHKSVSSLFAANTIRDFIEEFFGCSECVEHFLSMYDSCWNSWCEKITEDVSNDSDINTKNVALWLWDVHNDVNVRLMKESAERRGEAYNDSDKIKALWPSEKDCKECWNGDRSYNSDAVINYLRDVYWSSPQNKSSTRVTKRTERKKKPSMPLSTIFIAFICLWLMTMWYVQRKRYIERSGRHKKYDADRNILDNA